MNWHFCNNDESYELLTRDDDGKICASVFIDDAGITAFVNKKKKTVIKEFPKGTNLLKVQEYIKTELKQNIAIGVELEVKR